MNVAHASALSASTTPIVPWELLGVPLSLWAFAPSTHNDGTLTTKPNPRTTTA